MTYPKDSESVICVENSNYRVYKDGKIWSTPRSGTKGGFLKSPIGSRGYYYINLGKHNIVRSVHRLVAIAFIPNPENLPEVNHIDGDKLNNNVSNLEWCTSKHNTNHAIEMGLISYRYGSDRINSVFSERDIENIRTSDLGCRKLGRLIGVSHACISDIRNYKTYPFRTLRIE